MFGILTLIAVGGVAAGLLSIPFVIAADRTAHAIQDVPVIGPSLTTDCYRCEDATLWFGAEEMPVDFRRGPGRPVERATTVRFCRHCSLHMTSRERVRLARGAFSVSSIEDAGPLVEVCDALQDDEGGES